MHDCPDRSYDMCGKDVDGLVWQSRVRVPTSYHIQMASTSSAGHVTAAAISATKESSAMRCADLPSIDLTSVGESLAMSDVRAGLSRRNLPAGVALRPFYARTLQRLATDTARRSVRRSSARRRRRSAAARPCRSAAARTRLRARARGPSGRYTSSYSKAEQFWRLAFTTWRPSASSGSRMAFTSRCPASRPG